MSRILFTGGGGLVPGEGGEGGSQIFWRGSPIFGGVSNFSGGRSPIFRGGVSNFSGGVSNFSGGLQFFFSFFFNFFPPQKIFWDAPHPPETVNARPVRILLECILVMTYFHIVGGGGRRRGPLSLPGSATVTLVAAIPRNSVCSVTKVFLSSKNRFTFFYHLH